MLVRVNLNDTKATPRNASGSRSDSRRLPRQPGSVRETVLGFIYSATLMYRQRSYTYNAAYYISKQESESLACCFIIYFALLFANACCAATLAS
jgi:hypothetical protein